MSGPTSEFLEEVRCTVEEMDLQMEHRVQVHTSSPSAGSSDDPFVRWAGSKRVFQELSDLFFLDVREEMEEP